MDNDNLQIFVKISAQLGEISADIKNMCSTIADHEARLDKLEENRKSFKDEIIPWLVKALIIALITIGSLTGAGGLLQQILGK